MPWFYVDDAFADSKPVMKLDRALRNEAIGLWVRCGAWSAKEETDGRVPLDTVRQFGGTPRLIRALHQQAELWVENSPDSWQETREVLFGNWEKWQKTRAELAAKRRDAAERQRKSRANKPKGRNAVSSSDMAESQSDSDVTKNESHETVTRDPHAGARRPDPTRPDPSLVETSSGGVTPVDAHEPAPPKCPRHKENSPTPCPACKARRKWEESQAEAQKADEVDKRRQRKRAIADCPACDDNGLVDLGNRVAKCTHGQELANA